MSALGYINPFPEITPDNCKKVVLLNARTFFNTTDPETRYALADGLQKRINDLSAETIQKIDARTLSELKRLASMNKRPDTKIPAPTLPTSEDKAAAQPAGSSENVGQGMLTPAPQEERLETSDFMNEQEALFQIYQSPVTQPTETPKSAENKDKPLTLEQLKYKILDLNQHDEKTINDLLKNLRALPEGEIKKLSPFIDLFFRNKPNSIFVFDLFEYFLLSESFDSMHDHFKTYIEVTEQRKLGIPQFAVNALREKVLAKINKLSQDNSGLVSEKHPLAQIIDMILEVRIAPTTHGTSKAGDNGAESDADEEPWGSTPPEGSTIDPSADTEKNDDPWAEAEAVDSPALKP